MPEPAGVLAVAAEGVAGAGVAWAAGGAAAAGLGVALPETSDFGAAGAGAAPCVDSGFASVAVGVAAAGAALAGAALAGAALTGLSPGMLEGSARAPPAEAASRSATAVEASNRSRRIPGIT